MFLLFAGNDYYPKGGAMDLKGRFESVDHAISAHNPREYKYDGGWANILDLGKMEVIMIFNGGAWKDYDPDGYDSDDFE